MPHVVLEGVIDLESYVQQFEPIFLRNDRDVLRADHIFLSRDMRTVLIEALALEAGRKQPFYVKVSAHDRGGATVRIDPMTHPERSEGVRTLVAEIGADLLRRSPDARLRVTNLDMPSPDSGKGEGQQR